MLPAVLVLPADQRLIDVLHRGAVEHRRGDIDLRVGAVGRVARDDLRLLLGPRAVVIPAVGRDPAEVRLEDLTQVHPARHAERVEDHVDRGAVLEERHVLDVDDLRDDALVAVAAGELVALGDLALLGDEHAHQVIDAGRQIVAVVAAEGLDVDHDAALTVRHLERGVTDLTCLLLEDRADQLLLGGQLGLALGRDLADEQVAGLDLGADADDAAVVEVAQRLLASGSGCRG